MTNFSAIALDVDGTLLNSRGKIPRATLLALRECHRKSILLYIATARPQRLVFRPDETDGDIQFLTERGVFYNGAVAIDHPLNFYARWPISAGTVRSVATFLSNSVPDLQIAIQHNDDYHAFHLPMTNEELATWGFTRAELLPFPEAARREASKIVVFHQTRQILDLHRELISRFGDQVNAFPTDSGTWISIISHSTNKETALLHLLSQRSISPEKVIVFGDDLPDAGMFRTFGCSVAMGNASDELKQTATHVTLSNDKDGIAHALRNLLKII